MARYNEPERKIMLFSLTVDYTAQSLNSMRENPNTNRREALNQLLEAAGGKLVSFYHTIENGPGAQVTFDVPDGSVAAAITSVAVSSGAVHHAHLTRLYTTDEVAAIRQKASQIRGAYKAPGQQ